MNSLQLLGVMASGACFGVQPWDAVGDKRQLLTNISHAASVDWAIGVLSAGQQTNVTRQQLLEAGLSSGAIRNRINAGRLYPSYPGVYGVGKPSTTPLERAAAAVLACGPAAALSHASA